MICLKNSKMLYTLVYYPPAIKDVVSVEEGDGTALQSALHDFITKYGIDAEETHKVLVVSHDADGPREEMFVEEEDIFGNEYEDEV